MIYLDHAATSPPLQCAKIAFNAASTAAWGNPNSLHSFGQSARNALEASREAVAQCLKCDSDQVFFVSSATEACRIAITRMTEACKKIYVTKIEHAAVTSIQTARYIVTAGMVIVVSCIFTPTTKPVKSMI